MKTNFFFLSIIALLLGSCGNNPKTTNKQVEAVNEQTATTITAKTLLFNPDELGEEPVLAIETSKGVIIVKLYKNTPQHRDNFVKLASEGYYNGLIFHRVIKGFMIQAGDPDSKNPQPDAHYGSGGPGYTVPAEIVPQYTHKKGALAAARQGDAVNPEKASSGSQFYLVENPAACSHLDGAYTIFGETVNGLEIIDKIAATATGANDRPVEDIFILNIQPAQK